MADNIQLNTGTGGDKLSAHDLGGDVKLQKLIQAGVQSSVNTTTSTLSGGATYTGGWEQNSFSDVMVSCHTDTEATLYFDFSPDGTTNNSFPVNGFQVKPGIHEFHTAIKGPRFFRIRLVNGNSAQSYLRLYTYFGTFRQGNLPINANIASDSDAIVVRSINAETDLAFNKIEGMKEDEKFSSIALIDSADCPATIWAYGSDSNESGAEKTFPTTSQDIFISSDSASDTNVDIDISYIDIDGNENSISVNLNGQTPIDTTANGFDVLRAFNSGSISAVGNIYINTENNHTAGVPNDPSTVLAYIEQGFGQTQLGTFTVPLGKQIRIKHINILIARDSGQAGSAEVILSTREFGKTWLVKRRFFLTTSLGVNEDMAGLIFPARTNIELKLQSVSSNDTNCNASFVYELIEE